MGNIDTYLQQNAAETFAERPFGEVDGLVLAYLAYFRFDSIVPGWKEGTIPLAEAAARYLEITGDTQTDVDAKVLRHAAATRRFGQLLLSDYESHFEKERTQFAALCFHLDDGTNFLAFRGANDTLTAFQEAFAASYQITSAQKSAAAYLARHLEETEANLLIGGHSKGGNHALFAMLFCAGQTTGRVRAIYLYDSPGLDQRDGSFFPNSTDKLGSKEPSLLSTTISRFAPQYALIGRLFESETQVYTQARKKGTAPSAATPRFDAAPLSDVSPLVFVEAAGEDLQQHEPLAWQVEGDGFVRAKGPEKKSARMTRVLARWISKTNQEERKAFVADLFRYLREERAAQRESEERTGGSARKRRPSAPKLALRFYRGATKLSRRATRKLVRAWIRGRFF